MSLRATEISQTCLCGFAKKGKTPTEFLGRGEREWSWRKEREEGKENMSSNI